MSSIAPRPRVGDPEPGRSRDASRRPRGAKRALFGYGVYAAFTVSIFAPLAAIVVMATGKGWFGGRWLPETWTLKWFTFASNAADLPSLLANTLIIAGLSIVISMAVGIPAAWALARRRVRIRGLLLLLLLVPRMIPPMTVALGVSREFYMLGLVDTHLGVAIAHSILVVPLVILVMSAAFEGLDEHLLEAARVCGANGVQTLWHVVRPLTLPGLLAATLFAFVTSVNEFTLTLLTYGPTTVTLTIQTYIEIDKGFREIASAISVILLAPSLLLLIAIQKYIRPEKIIGGLKGL